MESCFFCIVSVFSRNFPIIFRENFSLFFSQRFAKIWSQKFRIIFFAKFLNWVFATNSDFLITISLEPNVADLRYFKLLILLDQIIWIWNIKGLQHGVLKILRFKYLILLQRLNFFRENFALPISRIFFFAKRLKQNSFHWTSPRITPTLLIGELQIFIGDPRFLLGTTRILLETPRLETLNFPLEIHIYWRPQIFVRDPKKFIRDPK